jgi:molecular chaperone GrpE
MKDSDKNDNKIFDIDEQIEDFDESKDKNLNDNKQSESIDEIDESTAVQDEVDNQDKGHDVKDLLSKIATLEKQSKENYDLAIRTASELENNRKRSNNELIKARKFSIENIVKALVPCLDSLEQASNVKDATAEQMQEGIDLTLKLMIDSLAKNKVNRINPNKSEKFNPLLHEAMSLLPSDELEDDTIVEVFQIGYSIEDRIIRPARVVVAKKNN